MAEADVKAEVVLKLEFFNPIASVKDRIAVGMIEAMEAEGRLKPGSTVVEPTSGNTGIGLAFICAARGYRLVLTMPESMSIERRKMLKFMGAELELTPKEKGMKGAIERAGELLDEIEGAVMPGQFTNPANPRDPPPHDGRGDLARHRWQGRRRRRRGRHRWHHHRHRERLEGAQARRTHGGGSSPRRAPVLSGGQPGPHMIQGIGAGFVPDVLDTESYDEVVKIGNETALATARKLAKLDGIPVGISAGAALAAAVEVAHRPEMEGKLIVAIMCSFAERYLSTALFEGV